MKSLPKFIHAALVSAIFIFGTICIISTGGDGGGSSDSETPQSIETFSIESDEVGINYNISVGLPPTYDETGTPHAALFLLDGDNFFNDFYESYDEDDDIILIGINNTHRRNIDYLPVNTCETEGGGNTNFLDFLVNELVPYLDSKYNIDPSLRLLFGHSHGGSFVFYTLFTDHGETFPLLFSNDASLECWGVLALEQSYYSESINLPAIFYSSGATEGGADEVRPVMEKIINREYVGLKVKYDEIQGTHGGILNTAFSNGFDWIGSQLPDSSD
jgi:predicted alpha/beta superfamily hydrolase